MAASVRDLLIARAEADPDGDYLLGARDGRTLGNAELLRRVRYWAEALDGLGAPPGARVALDVRDPLTFATAHLAVIAAGRCSAPLNPEAPPAEARRSRDVLRPALVVTDRPGRPGLLVGRDDGLPQPIPRIGSPAPSTPPVAAGAAALLTSGSTGRPKTVLLTEPQLLHVARAVARHHRLTPDDRGFNPLPLFHVNAQVVGLLATLVAGGTLVLDQRFHRTDFWRPLREHDVTWLNAAPTILSILAADPVHPRPRRLRFIRSASAPLPEPLRETIVARTGVPVVESYGMTEAASQITATPLDRPRRAGSVGPVVDGELRVVDQDGHDCPPGVVGRVRIRGAGVIRRYADGAGADRFDPGGWLDTADLGHLDADRHLYLAGRADDVINRGGELVYPREIEEVLLADPGVAEAVVVGRAEPVLGAVPIACVLPRNQDNRADDDTADDADEVDEDPRAAAELTARLEARCVEQLARYKRPVEIRVVTGFPIGPTGKVRRAEVRRRVAGGDGGRRPPAGSAAVGR
jgi:acyl-CoA synthetase (AMP-forming)/AMP-acid ligase II